MKAVLDTNVVVSGVLSAHGPCGRILDAMTESLFDACVDDRIVAEYDDVLRRPELALDVDVTTPLLEWVRSTGLVVSAPPLAVELPDLDDLPFLEVAAAAGAHLVTGNLRHFPRSARRGVKVISPREFLAILAGSS